MYNPISLVNQLEMKKITQVDENKLIITDKTIAKKRSSYYERIVENLQNKAEKFIVDDLRGIIGNF